MSNGSKEMTIYKKSCTGITMEEIERWFADEIKIAKLQRNKKAQDDLKKELGKIRRNEKSPNSSRWIIGELMPTTIKEQGKQ